MIKHFYQNVRRGLFTCTGILSFLLFTQNANAQVDVTATAGTLTATYTNLSSAFTAINGGTHQGDITININTSFTDAATAVLNSSGAGSAVYTSVYIRPVNDGITISFASAGGRGVIELNGADNLTIDGDNPNTSGTNRNLTITNTATATTTYTSVVRIANSTAVTSTNNITIKNCTLNGSATGRNISSATSNTGSENTTFGIYCGGNGGATATTAPTALTSVTGNTAPSTTTINTLLIDNNAVNQCARGIYFNGASSTVSTGVTITNNLVGNQSTTLSGTPPYTTPTTTVYTKGIYLAGTNALTITGNSVKNIISYVATSTIGIELNSAIGTGGVTISNNTITGVVCNTTSSAFGINIASCASNPVVSGNTISNIQTAGNSTNSIAGLQWNYSGTGSTIERNIISMVYNRTTNGYGSYGINANGGNNATIQNNFVYDINAFLNNTGLTTQFGPMGIRIAAGTGHKIYNNSVSLSGAALGSSSFTSSAAFVITATSLTGLDVRNNIFSNTLTGMPASSSATAIMLPSGGTSGMNLTLNNNQYYEGSGTGAGIAQVGTTTGVGNYLAANFVAGATSPATNLRSYTSTLSAAGTNDNLSGASSLAAPFISSTDLHINTGAINATDVNAKAVVIAGLTIDIDGDTRDVSTPDIGADEFNLPSCTSASGGTITPATAAICAGATYTMSSTGATTGLGITYQWEVSTTGGGTGFSNVTGGSGATTTSYTTGTLTAGTYYYRLNTTCTLASLTGYSNELIVTVNPTPTVNVTPTTGSFCSPGGTAVALTASGASTYSWSPTSGLSASTGASVNASPTSTLTYTVTGTDGIGCTGTATATINVTYTPSTPVITPSAPTVCPGGSVVLNAPSTSTTTNVLGTGTTTTILSSTTATNFPNPYAHYYGGNKHQILVLASDLTSLGMSAGSVITGIGFPIASVNRVDALQSFEIKMGLTSLTSLTTFQTGLTTVSPAATYTTSAAPGVNTHTLGTSFIWDGSSNLIIETSYSNNDGPTSGNVTMTYGTTAYQSCLVYRADNIAPATMNSYTGATSFVLSARPNITFIHNLPLTYSWSPSTGLSATTGSPVTASPSTTTTYTLTAANGSCTNTNNVTVTIGDVTNPTITCPATVTVNTDVAACTATGVALGTPVTADNCVVASVTNNAPSSYPLGNTTVTWTVLDGLGNSATCAQTVTVNDVELPTITCPTNLTVNADAGSCVATNVTEGTPIVNDNCSTSLNDPTLASYNLGLNSLSWIVMDGTGNLATCTQTIIVVDNQNPIITCPATVNVNTDAGSCNATSVSLGTPTTSDNCTVASVTNNAPASYPVGTTTVTWTVTDANSNSATCTQTVVVTDNQNPTITCPATVNANTDAGSCTATSVSLGTPATSDNCTVASVTNNAPASYPVGTTTVTWTVTDVNGNSATCTQSVIVTDNQNPTITCPATVNANTDAGSCTATSVSLGTPVTNDNCTVASVTNNAPVSYPAGSTTVTWTVTDANGNSATCTQSVIVTDNQNPTITCPATVNANTDAGSCTATSVSLGTPVTNDNCTVASVTNNAPASYPVGTTTVTWTVTDANGNSATCTQSVIVTDNQNPTITCPANETIPADAGSCIATGILLIPASGADNCSSVTITNNAPATFPLGSTIVTWTATDASSNVATCSQTVLIIDTENPTITCAPGITVNTNTGSCSATGVSLTTPTTGDNCSVATVTNNAPTSFPLGNTTVTWTVTDGSSNTATCTQIVTVTDNQAPIVTGCPSNITINANNSGCTGIATWTAPSASDNCGTVTSSSTHSSGSIFPLGTTTVTYTFNDGHGNNATCSFTVTVNNNLNSTLITSNATCFGVSNGSIDLTVSGGNAPFAYDWNNDGTGDTDDSQDLSSISSGSYSVTISDANGCTATNSATITQPTQLTATLVSTTNPSGCGLSDGAIDIAVSGATPGYTYDWDNDGTGDTDDTQDLTGLNAGAYTVTIMDANSCSTTLSANLTDPNGPTIAINSVANATCFGGSNGAIDIAITLNGGAVSYTVIWDDPAATITDDVSGLTAGTYNVIVVDNNGCTGSTNATITQPSAITLLPSITNATCNGSATGAIDLTVTGGTGSYTFDWDNDGTGDADDTEDLSGLTAGNYTVVVSDANSCTQTTTVTINEPTAISATAVITEPTCNGGNDGAINLSVAGGTPAYGFAWSNSAISEDISTLTDGVYTVDITDANTCNGSFTFTVTEPSAIVLTQSLTLCFGSSYTIGSNTYTTSGTYTDVFTTPSGCDSTIVTNLTVNAPVNVNTSVSGITITAVSTSATSYQWVDCDNGFGTIAGETNQDFTPIANGNYAVVVIENGCPDTSACINITGVGINGINANLFSIYPNPTNGIFTIETPVQATVIITNMIGDIVLNQNVTQGTNQLNLTNVSRGAYTVRIMDSTNNQLLKAERLMIQR